jgi:hypothetical protein
LAFAFVKTKLRSSIICFIFLFSSIKRCNCISEWRSPTFLFFLLSRA